LLKNDFFEMKNFLKKASIKKEKNVIGQPTMKKKRNLNLRQHRRKLI